MDTEFLKSLLLVIEAGSIAEAARRQNLTAAAVGQRIRAIEHKLGKPLLERVGVTSKPTVACRTILPHVRSLVEDADALSERLDESEMTGTLRIGAISTQVADTIPYILEAFNRQCPRVHLHIVPGTSRQLYEALNQGQLDLALMVAPDFDLPKSRKVERFHSEDFVLISGGAPEEPLARFLATRPYIRYDSDSWGGIMVERYLAERDISPHVLCDLDSLETIAAMVGNGMGFSILPHWVGLDRHRSRLCVRPLEPPGPSREICLLYNIPVRLPNAVKILVNLCRSQNESRSINGGGGAIEPKA